MAAADGTRFRMSRASHIASPSSRLALRYLPLLTERHFIPPSRVIVGRRVFFCAAFGACRCFAY